VTSSLDFRILGPLTVERDGEPLRIGGPKSRQLLAMLLLNAGRVVSVDQLIEALWNDEPPGRATPTLQVHLSNLRKSFGDALPSIITQPPGYVLHAAATELDLLRFEELVQLAHAQRDTGALESAAVLLTEALALWRGPALADLEDSGTVQAARAWLDERRLGAVEDRATVLLALGREREAVADLDREVRAHPLRESLWEPLVLALYRSGRQADALTAYGRARRTLREELGIEPGPRLKALEVAVLRQDPELELRAPGGVPQIEPDVTTRAPVRVKGSLTLADGRLVALTERISIGRLAECDVTLVDPSVSRRHAEIRSTMAGFLLMDLSSSNGTRVSGRQVMQQLLTHGDEIEIGGTVLTFLNGRA
jgi:DNA-binding SARP family transcriptional activator